MSFRALSLALILAAAMTGCAKGANPAASARTAAMGARAKSPVEAMEFQAAAVRANELIKTYPGFKNARLVSIEGHGFDQDGKMVPLLGSYWVFKYWGNAVDDEGTVEQATTRCDVTLHIEGTYGVEPGGETKEGSLERVLDPAKLATPTTIVPFAIDMGLKVNPAGPAFNYYDVTYNAFYANPSAASTDVADVTSYYQRDTFDGMHIPARPGVAPGGAPVAKQVTKMSGQELSRETAERLSAR